MNKPDQNVDREQSRENSIVRFVSGETRLSEYDTAKILGVVVLVFLPAIIGGYFMDILITALCLGIFAMSVDLVWGYGGIMTFGHAVFFGFGAYLMALITKGVGLGGLESYLGIIAGTAAPALVGLLVAGILMYSDISEMSFAIITLALGVLSAQIVLLLRGFTGGSNGITGIPELQLGIPYVQMIPISDLTMYYVTVFLTVAIFILLKRIVDSPFGRATVAIRENEDQAKSLGYNSRWYKTLLFGIGSGMAGFAGSIYVTNQGFVSPAVVGFLLSTSVVIWTLIGGKGTLIGPLFAAVLVTLLENLLSGAFTFTWQIMLGGVFVIFVLLVPDGLAGLVERSRNQLQEIRS